MIKALERLRAKIEGMTPGQWWVSEDGAFYTGEPGVDAKPIPLWFANAAGILELVNMRHVLLEFVEAGIALEDAKVASAALRARYAPLMPPGVADAIAVDRALDEIHACHRVEIEAWRRYAAAVAAIRALP
jgi:hypothetical protein